MFKNTKNKFMASAAAAALVVSAVAPVAGAEEAKTGFVFSDVSAHDSHFKAIHTARDYKILSGYPDGTFKPARALTRSNVVKALGKYVVAQSGKSVAEFDLSDVKPFNDVPAMHNDEELFTYSLIVKQAGIFSGSNNNLMPTNLISRQQIAKVLVEAFGLEDRLFGSSKVTDNRNAFEEFIPYIDILSEHRVTDVENFMPKSNTTRAQFASFLVRSYEASPGVDDVAPELHAATPVQLLQPQKVKINFNEAMDKASIENKDNYLVGASALNDKVTVSAAYNNKAVILDFTNVSAADDIGQADISEGTINVERVADASGNLISAASTPVQVPAAPSAPLLETAVATDERTVKLYFDEEIVNAEAKDFRVLVGEGFTNVTDVSNEVVDGRSVLTLNTATTGIYISIDTAVTGVRVYTAADGNVNAENRYGTAVSLNSAYVEDGYAPTIDGANAEDNDNDSFVDTIRLFSAEYLYVPSVQSTDFSIDGYTITGISFDGGHMVEIYVKEKTVSDLKVRPTIRLVGEIEDLSRNIRSSQRALSAMEVEHISKR